MTNAMKNYTPTDDDVRSMAICLHARWIVQRFRRSSEEWPRLPPHSQHAWSERARVVLEHIRYLPSIAAMHAPREPTDEDFERAGDAASEETWKSRSSTDKWIAVARVVWDCLTAPPPGVIDRNWSA